MGSLMLVWFEGDVEKAFTYLATDNDEYHTWFRGRVLDITGAWRHRRTARLQRSSSTTASDLQLDADT